LAKLGSKAFKKDAIEAGKDFTRAQKREILNANRSKNLGELRSDKSGDGLIPSKKSEKGITPAKNEAQVDHIYPKSKGGENSRENAQVLSREENRAKADKLPDSDASKTEPPKESPKTEGLDQCAVFPQGGRLDPVEGH
jgi:5-methylcytosine-specific restriction endonuclease McrA